jgi:hypothetical protein
MGIGTDDEGNIYLSNYRVRVFTHEGKILNSFDIRGDRAGEFNCPTGLWYITANLFIADTVNRRIELFRIHSRTTQTDKMLSASGGNAELASLTPPLQRYATCGGPEGSNCPSRPRRTEYVFYPKSRNGSACTNVCDFQRHACDGT